MSETTAKGGNVILRDVRVPETARPGESVTVEFDVSNGANFIGPFDADRCEDGPIGGAFASGYKLRCVAVLPDGSTRETGEACLGTTEVGTVDNTFSLTFTAPDSTGDHSIQGYVELPGSGETTGRQSEYLTVTESAPSQPDNGDSGSGSGGGSSPGAGFDPGDLFEDLPDAPDAGSPISFDPLGDVDPETILWALIAVAALYAFGQGFDVDLGGGNGGANGA